MTRGHEVTLAKQQRRLVFRKFSFSERSVNDWDRLSAVRLRCQQCSYVKKNGHIPQKIDELDV